ncbi:MAG TPA: antibiotic biosynthesis monooxygenase [Acidimicrobiales bacterium]|nr:antibiotic biosynthesis monooxygenase [Acidimicrobiales bacterium]
MTTVAVRHHVADFDTWLIGYKEHGQVRDRLGCTADEVLRGESDPNEVLVLTHWPSAEAAHRFASDPALPQVMKNAGVIDEPRIEFYEESGA